MKFVVASILAVAAAASANSFIVHDGTLQSLNWPKNLPHCAGDCDSDANCAKGLKCFQQDAHVQAPGCKAGGSLAMDYCYKPKDVKTVKVTSEGRYHPGHTKTFRCGAGLQVMLQGPAARWKGYNCDSRDQCHIIVDEDCNVKTLFFERCEAQRDKYDWSGFIRNGVSQSGACKMKVAQQNMPLREADDSDEEDVQTSSSSGTDFSMSGFPFLDSPDHMAEAERKRQLFLSENLRLARNRALKTRAYFNARDVAAAKHKWTAVFYSRMSKAKSFSAAMKSLHTTALAHELAMQVKRRTAFTAWTIARNTNERALHARTAATAAYAAAVKAFELARDSMGSGKKTLASAWAHYRSTLKIRVAAREEYVKWGKAHRAAIKGREAAGLKAAEAAQAHMLAHKKHTISVTVHIAAVKRRAAARAAAIRAHMAVKRHAQSGYMYLAQKN